MATILPSASESLGWNHYLRALGGKNCRPGRGMIHLGSTHRRVERLFVGRPRGLYRRAPVPAVPFLQRRLTRWHWHGVCCAARPAQAGHALAGTRELSAESAFVDCFLSNPCYETLRSNHCLVGNKWGTRSLPREDFQATRQLRLGCGRLTSMLRPLSPKCRLELAVSARANDRLNDLRPPVI